MNWKRRYHKIKNLQLGDKVRVRKDLNEDTWYGEQMVVHQMLKFRGQIITISQLVDEDYQIKEDGEDWYWTDEMFSERIR